MIGVELSGRSSTQETDLTTFLPSNARGGSSCGGGSRQVRRRAVQVVAAFANDRAKMHTAARAHPDPTALCIGFSGRSSKKSDPTVVGQVADMSMRSVFCPIVVCKHAPVNAVEKTPLRLHRGRDGPLHRRHEDPRLLELPPEG